MDPRGRRGLSAGANFSFRWDGRGTHTPHVGALSWRMPGAEFGTAGLDREFVSFCGEALVGVRQLGFIITGAIMGSVLFRLLVAIALRAGLDPNDLKLVTAVFVFCALILPGLLKRIAGVRTAAR